MKRSILAVSCLIVIFFTGCAGTIVNGKAFNYEVVPQIVKGKSTQKDVSKLIGEPMSVRKTDDGEVWAFFSITNGYLVDTNRNLNIYFDKSGVVTDYSYRE